MIEITNLTKRYNKSDKLAVNDLTLTVKAGEIFGFLGPNGAGKSTTIKCLTGILPFSDGHIKICGHDIKDEPLAAKNNIGFVPDNHATYEKLTGREYVNFMADIFNTPAEEKKQREERLIKDFDLEDAYDQQIKSYSHGMKQKICVIGALIHNPKVWVLDEPLTGLDPKSAFKLKELMRQHCDEGNTVFFSSHVLEVVEKVCDRVGIIANGQLIAVCTMAELKEKRKDLSLESFFLNITGESSTLDEINESKANAEVETAEDIKDADAKGE